MGAGGNGAVIDFLLRVGYQHFVIVDFDVVEATNLNRLPFTPEYIGKGQAGGVERIFGESQPRVNR